MSRQTDRQRDRPRRGAAWEVERWAEAGAMALTGRSDGPPLGPPAQLVTKLTEIADSLRERAAGLGAEIRLDPVETLTHRAALLGLRRQGTTSCGGATRLLRAADGWMAVALPRPHDIDLVPAWLGLEKPPKDVWACVAEEIERRTTSPLVAHAAALGLPVAALGERRRPSGGLGRAVGQPATPGGATGSVMAGLPVRRRRQGGEPAPAAVEDLVVADLSSLWAGPLCGRLLAELGATVLKVESTGRPDGARAHHRFFDHLNGTKASVAIDLQTAEGRQQLRWILGQVDIVIEASRPRALEQLGIYRERLMEGDGPRLWISITGHGRSPSVALRVGFGDDAAVAGGLVSWEGTDPRFTADAIADPMTGLVAATAAVDALATGGRWLVDVDLAGVSAAMAGPTLPVLPGVEPASPRPPATNRAAPSLGADTRRALHQLERR